MDQQSRISQVLHPTFNTNKETKVFSPATGWTTRRKKFDPRQRRKHFSSVFKPALGPTQSPVQWVPGVISPGLKRGRGVTLTTHPHLVPRSRMSRSYTSSPPSASVACSRTDLALDKSNKYCAG
jgi:hypothetical protein